MDVYFAYNNSAALTLGQSLWNRAFPSQVQPGQVAPALGDLPISSSCNNGLCFLCVVDSVLSRATDFGFSESVAGAVVGIAVRPTSVYNFKTYS